MTNLSKLLIHPFAALCDRRNSLRLLEGTA